MPIDICVNMVYNIIVNKRKRKPRKPRKGEKMRARLIGHKYGAFTKKDTGERIKYDKMVFVSTDIASYERNDTHYVGYQVIEIPSRDLHKPSTSYDDLIGKVVDLVYDQVLGRINPSLVDINTDGKEE